MMILKYDKGTNVSNDELMRYLTGEKEELQIKDLVCLFNFKKGDENSFNEIMNDETVLNGSKRYIEVGGLETDWCWVGQIKNKYDQDTFLLYNLKERRIFADFINLMFKPGELKETWNGFEVTQACEVGKRERMKLLAKHEREFNEKFGSRIIERVNNDEIKITAPTFVDHDYILTNAEVVFHEIHEMPEPQYFFETNRVFDTRGLSLFSATKLIEVLIDPQKFLSKVLEREYGEIGYNDDSATWYYYEYYVKQYYLENRETWEKDLYHCTYRHLIRLTKEHELDGKTFTAQVGGKRVKLTYHSCYPWGFGTGKGHHHISYQDVEKIWVDNKMVYSKERFTREFEGRGQRGLLKGLIEFEDWSNDLNAPQKRNIPQGQLALAF